MASFVVVIVVCTVTKLNFLSMCTCIEFMPLQKIRCKVGTVSEFNKMKQELRKELNNRRARARRRKAATGTVTVGSRTTTTESGEGPCGRSGSESDIREYDLWVKRDITDADVSVYIHTYVSVYACISVCLSMYVAVCLSMCYTLHAHNSATKTFVPGFVAVGCRLLDRFTEKSPTVGVQRPSDGDRLFGQNTNY